jgi:hypothetical protein
MLLLLESATPPRILDVRSLINQTSSKLGKISGFSVCISLYIFVSLECKLILMYSHELVERSL